MKKKSIWILVISTAAVAAIGTALYIRSLRAELAEWKKKLQDLTKDDFRYLEDEDVF